MSIAAIASLAATILALSTVKQLPFSHRLVRYGFTASTFLGTWRRVATLFSFHYAPAFYNSPSELQALAFPDQQQNPNDWDFLYFSFTIAVAAQTDNAWRGA